jgi:hypothetical protein
MSALSILLIILAALLAAILVYVRRLSPAGVTACEPDWVDNFSVAKYRPMLRLLDPADFDFLTSQPGYSKKAMAQLRAERRSIFRAYLRNLVRDFHRLHLAARMHLVAGEQDRPELAALLVRQRLMFLFAVTAVEVRLALHTFGIGAVDVRGLIAALETMRANVAPAPAFGAAAI